MINIFLSDYFAVLLNGNTNSISIVSRKSNSIMKTVVKELDTATINLNDGYRHFLEIEKSENYIAVVSIKLYFQNWCAVFDTF